MGLIRFIRAFTMIRSAKSYSIKYSLLLVFMILCNHAESHMIAISGRVISDSDGVPVVGAVCSTMINDSIVSKTTSDNYGIFILDCHPADQLVLSILADEYDPYLVEINNAVSDVNIGECRLTSSKDLDEVVVEAQNTAYRKGRIIYTPRKSDVEISTKANELIGHMGIPGILYNPLNKTFSVFGSNPVILINGTPSDQSDLKSIASKDIISVEFSDVVPLLYASLGNYLINVKVKREPVGGTFDMWEINDFIGTAVDTSPTFTFNAGPSQWKTSYTLSYRNNHNSNTENSVAYTNHQKEISINSSAESPFIYRTHNASIQYLYNPDESLAVSARLSLTALNDQRKFIGRETSNVFEDYNIDNRSKSRNIKPTLDLYFLKTFNQRNSLEINIVGNYSYNYYDILKQYDGDKINDNIDNGTKAKRYSLLTALSYEHTFGKQTYFNMSYENGLSYNRNDYFLQNQDATLKENNNSVFAQVVQPVGNFWFTLRSGLQFNWLKENDNQQKYLNNSTLFTINWRVNPKWTISNRFNFLPGTLSLAQLDDICQTVNPYLITTGNPELKRSTTVSDVLYASFYHGIWNFNSSIDISDTHNPVLNTTLYDKNRGCYVSRPINGNQNAGFKFSVQGGLSGLLNMFVFQGTLTFGHFRTLTSDWKLIRNSVGGQFYAGWYYKKWTVIYSRVFPLKNVSGYVFSQEGEKYDSLVVRFKPDNHWEIGLEWAYMFQPKGWLFDYDIVSPEFTGHNHQEIRNNANWVRLSLTYSTSFGDIFNLKGKRRSINLKDNQTTFRKINN